MDQLHVEVVGNGWSRPKKIRRYRGRLGSVGARLPVCVEVELRRARPVAALKGAREDGGGAVAAGSGDALPRRWRPKPCQAKGTLEPQPCSELMDGFTDQSFEHAVEVMRRKAGGIGEGLKVELGLDAGIDQRDRPVHAGLMPSMPSCCYRRRRPFLARRSGTCGQCLVRRYVLRHSVGSIVWSKCKCGCSTECCARGSSVAN